MNSKFSVPLEFCSMIAELGNQLNEAFPFSAKRGLWTVQIGVIPPIPVLFDGVVAGAFIYQDQWQFEFDSGYWGLS